MEKPEEWKDEKDREIDQTLENQSLEDDIKSKGDIMSKNDDIDPAIHNRFLKHVLDFEEMDKQPQIPVKSLFPEGFTFPPADTLDDKQLAAKLDEICDILYRHHIVVGLSEKLPDKLVYEYLVNDVIPHEEAFKEFPEGMRTHLDGCGGYCPDCFQKDYCDSARETWPELFKDK